MRISLHFHEEKTCYRFQRILIFEALDGSKFFFRKMLLVIGSSIFSNPCSFPVGQSLINPACHFSISSRLNLVLSLWMVPFWIKNVKFWPLFGLSGLEWLSQMSNRLEIQNSKINSIMKALDMLEHVVTKIIFEQKSIAIR